MLPDLTICNKFGYFLCKIVTKIWLWLLSNFGYSVLTGSELDLNKFSNASEFYKFDLLKTVGTIFNWFGTGSEQI